LDYIPLLKCPVQLKQIKGRLNAINEHVIKLEKIEHSYNEIQREYGKLEGKLEALTK